MTKISLYNNIFYIRFYIRFVNIIQDKNLEAVLQVYWKTEYWLFKSFKHLQKIIQKNKTNKVGKKAKAVVFYAVSEVIKYIVKEPRPCTIQSLSWINNISCESSFSFPSNHATVITGLGFFLNNYKYLRWLYWAWVIAVLFGRVYLGVHYLSDVIAGILISSMLYFVINRYRAKINSTANRIIRKVSPRLALEDKVN